MSHGSLKRSYTNWRDYIYIFLESLLEFHPPTSSSDVSISIGAVASQVFLSDQLFHVALILQVLKAGNVSYQLYPLLLYSESCIRWWHTQTRMKMRELTLREKQAIWMLKENSKSIRAIEKTTGMEKSRVWKPPATNNYLIGWENNSNWWQTSTTEEPLSVISSGELQMLHSRMQTSDQHQK